ncbi:MMPL family transporter [Streptomyces sp. NPDC057027]|uniref:MMPL family transporter n=1 Tax=Streptomyces sp. NPDC057027 TaxID=3346004 RepID=UPI00362CE5DA
MADRLFELGRWAARRRGRVLAGWLLLLAVIATLGTTLSGTLGTTYSVPGIESQKAQELLAEEFPVAVGGSTRIVFAAAPGKDLDRAGARTALADTLKRAAAIPGVVHVSDPQQTGAISRDRTIGYTDVQFAMAASDVPESATDALTKSATDPLREAGLQVEFGGTVTTPADGMGGSTEIVGVVIAFAVLAVTLGSLLAAGLPLLTALVGVAVGVLGVLFVSGFVDMTGTATVLALMIGLAVGIDYALFVICRHREQLAVPGSRVEESIGRATATAGTSVVFAGITVVVALAALSLTGIPFLAVMGLAAAGTVLIAVAVAVTLVPALLSYAGERLRPKPRPATARPEGAWGLAWARLVTRRPVLVVLAGVTLLLGLALPARDLRLGLPGNDSQPAASTLHRGYQLLTRGFGPGFNATLSVIVTDVPAAQRTQVLTELGKTLSTEEGVAVVAPPVTNADGSVAAIGLVPTTGPNDAATTDLVHRLRGDHHVVSRAGGTMYVAGATTAAIDISAKLSDALPLVIGITVLLALVLLTIAFRSLLVPLKAIAGFLLSVGASLGAVVWVFQDGHLADVFRLAAAAPILCFLPVLLIGVLFGLAMDYEVFLVARIREHYQHTGDANEAITHGVARSGRVVTAAALIMAAVFGGFIFTADPVIKSIGFALTVGVLIDAFLVRLTLVPAVLALLGNRAWHLPTWLERAVPHVDIEGSLTDQDPAPQPVTGDPTSPSEEGSTQSRRSPMRA